MANIIGIDQNDEKFLEDLRRFDAEKLIEMYGFKRDGGAIKATKNPHGEIVDNRDNFWCFRRGTPNDRKVYEIFEILLSQWENP